MPSKQELEATEKMIFGEPVRKSRVSKKDSYTLDEFNAEVIRQARDKFRGTQFEDTFEHFAGKWESDESIRGKFETFNDYLKDELSNLRKSRKTFAKSKKHQEIVAKHKSKIKKGIYYKDMGGIPHGATMSDVWEAVEIEFEKGYFDELIDEIYGDVEIAGYHYATSVALKRVDEVAYETLHDQELEWLVDDIMRDPSQGSQFGFFYMDDADAPDTWD